MASAQAGCTGERNQVIKRGRRQREQRAKAHTSDQGSVPLLSRARADPPAAAAPALSARLVPEKDEEHQLSGWAAATRTSVANECNGECLSGWNSRTRRAAALHTVHRWWLWAQAHAHGAREKVVSRGGGRGEEGL